MQRRWWVLVLAFVVVLVGALAFASTTVSLSARGGPGPLETYLATKAKRFLVSRSARGLEPPWLRETSVVEGFGAFAGSCASCHGVKGDNPTNIGRSMYPPTPSLSSPAVQAWSDAELFWIIKNGIRLTGMPAFGDLHSDEEIWNVVRYVRSLGEPAAK